MSRFWLNLPSAMTAAVMTLVLLALLRIETPHSVLVSKDKELWSDFNSELQENGSVVTNINNTAKETVAEKWREEMLREGKENIREPEINCTETDLFLIYVYSKPENKYQRQLVRETWGNVSRYRDVTSLRLRLFFIVGWRYERPGNWHVMEEADSSHDILLSDFEDSYDNLTLKGLTAIDWIRRRCDVGGLRFIFKTDDDVYVNLYAILNKVHRLLATNNTDFLCFVNKGKHPKRTGKWAISEELYSKPLYPSYCSGAGYGMTKRAFDLVSSSCFDVPLLLIEDLFFSSYCIRRKFPDVVIRYNSLPNRRCRLNMFHKNRTAIDESLVSLASLTLSHPLPAEYWHPITDIIQRQRN